MSIRIDQEVKAAAQEVAKSAGLTLGTLVNAYLRQVAATRHIDIYSPEPMSPKLESYVAEVEKEIERGDVSQSFDSVDDFLNDLKK